MQNVHDTEVDYQIVAGGSSGEGGRTSCCNGIDLLDEGVANRVCLARCASAVGVVLADDAALNAHPCPACIGVVVCGGAGKRLSVGGHDCLLNLLRIVVYVCANIATVRVQVQLHITSLYQTGGIRCMTTRVPRGMQYVDEGNKSTFNASSSIAPLCGIPCLSNFELLATWNSTVRVQSFEIIDRVPLLKRMPRPPGTRAA